MRNYIHGYIQIYMYVCTDTHHNTDTHTSTHATSIWIHTDNAHVALRAGLSIDAVMPSLPSDQAHVLASNSTSRFATTATGRIAPRDLRFCCSGAPSSRGFFGDSPPSSSCLVSLSGKCRRGVPGSLLLAAAGRFGLGCSGQVPPHGPHISRSKFRT